MLFMNKKEEVLDIELTPYGKYLLAKGQMRPVYYAFFDDNIAYDIRYAGAPAELQNDIQDRIRKTTPQLQTQHKFTSDASEGPEINFGTQDILIPEAPIVSNALAYPLSTAQISNNKVPAISLTMLNGNISSYDLDYRTTLGGNKAINQLNTNITYVVEKRNILKDIEADEGAVGNDYIESIPGSSGDYLQIRTDYLLVDLLEENADFDSENFDIEVFLIDKNYETGAQKELIPLVFAQPLPTSNIVNNILVDDVPGSFDEVELTPTNVEYYFHVYCDSEIDQEVLESSVVKLKSKGFFNDEAYDLNKAPQVIQSIADIYGTNVTAADIKDCD